MGASNIIKLIRLHQYIKNGFIFLPLFFASRITDTALLINAVIAFIAFSLTASAIYVLNDYRDIEDDKLHPTKKNRPLASGVITKPQGLVIMMLLLVSGVALAASVSFTAMAILLGYVVMNIAYSFYLKHIAILDVTIIAVGFVLRIFVGSAATDTPLSMWIIIMTFLLALFMALAKRRDDVLIYQETSEKIRKVVDGYSLQFLDIAMAIMASVVIVAYTIYTTSFEVIASVQNEYLYVTTIFVIVGILRYLQIAFIQQDSGSPTRIMLKDRFMQFTLMGWVTTFVWMLY
jgi:decaprenyl-phosphate phosphoribosyltransferase